MDVQTAIMETTGKRPSNERRWVPISGLRLDTYQRDRDRTTARDHWVAAQLKRGGFDDRVANSALISARGGQLWVVDGAGRVQLAEASGRTAIFAQVLSGLTKTQEAQLFLRVNQTRRKPSTWDIFAASLEARVPKALEVRAAVLDAGYALDRNRSDGRHVSAVATLYRIHDWGGADLLTRTLRSIREWWPDDRDALRAEFMGGVGLFLRWQPEADLKRCSMVFPRLSATTIIARGTAIASLARLSESNEGAVSQALTDIYNTRLQHKRLPALSRLGRQRSKVELGGVMPDYIP